MESPTSRNTVVATYESRAGAEVAFNTLREAGLDVNPLTILGTAVSAEEQAIRLTATGISAKKVMTYGRDVSSGKFLVVAGGSARVIGRVCALLGTTGPSRLAAHAA
jgi:hypothetical protein